MFKKLVGVLIMMAGTLGISGCAKDDNTAYQLKLPQKGEEIAVVSTSMGEIKIKLFPTEAPKAVENFKTHAKEGYYNNLIFHRVIENFMIQGGDPQGTGRGGESIWKTPFEDEFSDKLVNITGALAMANSGKNTNGSQFFINYMDKEEFNGWEYYQNAYDKYKTNPAEFSRRYGAVIDMSRLTDEVKKLYEENGGNPHLDGAFNTDNKGHTVFGQVFEGLDVVKSISLVKTDGMNRPTKDVIIKEIKIVKY